MWIHMDFIVERLSIVVPYFQTGFRLTIFEGFGRSLCWFKKSFNSCTNHSLKKIGYILVNLYFVWPRISGRWLVLTSGFPAFFHRPRLWVFVDSWALQGNINWPQGFVHPRGRGPHILGRIICYVFLYYIYILTYIYFYIFFIYYIVYMFIMHILKDMCVYIYIYIIYGSHPLLVLVGWLITGSLFWQSFLAIPIYKLSAIS